MKVMVTKNEICRALVMEANLIPINKFVKFISLPIDMSELKN